MSATSPGKSKTTAPAPRHEGRIDPQVWKIAGVVMLAPLMAQLDSTVVNVSLSTLAQELDTSLTTIQWVSSGYLLALALTLPLTGWLVDRLGAKRVYLICFSIFTLTSLFCGIATDASSLIVSRVLQGMAGGLLTPMSQMMMARTAGPHMARVMGFAVMPVMIGPILGPTLAGVILQHAGWPWIFLVNLPVGILATLLAWRVLPPDRDMRVRRNFDALGFLMLAPALAMLLHSLETLASTADAADAEAIWLELGAAVLLLAAFLWHAARRGGAALIDIRLFRARSFAPSAVTQFLTNCMTYGGQLLFPLYLIAARGYSPSRAGILLAAMGIGLLCAFPWMGRLTDRFGSRRVATAGALLGLAGTLPFMLVGLYDMPDTVICVLLWMRGMGLGSINIPSMSSAYASIPREKLPVATTALNIVQRLGGPIATTCLAIWLHASLAAHEARQAFAFSSTFAVFCVIHALGVVAALTIPARRK
ncbi:disulfide bond formation protein DsbA [Bordetella sp. H567]|uniref:DHA2 family efflux MFS transporter permease subunit n=1 Tax=Bordetella sp. H567 TaxID=1697043 RepID=UPI00081C6470|nr:DHA2 family efflux MFS transporter permease subunit [Bordetella sp. H567]AOB30283.1 disulfide bond formation protein DsbA [Bordetella sp. H567]